VRSGATAHPTFCGSLLANTDGAVLTAQSSSPARSDFHLLAKPTGAVCILDCKYCFNHLCAGYKAFFTHIDRPMRLMATLLRHGRYADEAMAMLA